MNAGILIIKALRGAQKAGAKYIRRVPKPGGGYTYIYKESHGSLKSNERKSVKNNAHLQHLDYKRNGVKSQTFKSWFGDWERDPKNSSKVVDEEGKPKETHSKVVDGDLGNPVVVYHGTASGGFSKFDPEKANPNGLYGPGFYFTEDRGVAEEYQGKDSTNPTVQLLDGKWNDIFNLLKQKSESNPEDLFLKDRLNEAKKAADGDRAAKDTIATDVMSGDSNTLYSEVLDAIKEKVHPREVKAVFLNIRKPFDADNERIEIVGRKVPEKGSKEYESLLYEKEKAKAGIAEKVEWQKRIRSMDEQEFQKDEEFEWLDARTREGAIDEIEGFIQSEKQMIEEVDSTLSKDFTYHQALKYFTNREMSYGEAAFAVYDILKNKGYDGITHIGGNIMGGGHEHRVWIAFAPNQIKAVDNYGTFDPQNSNIYKSMNGVKSMKDAFLLVMKAVKGSQKAGARYYKRVPKPGGGYKYYYTKEQYQKDRENKKPEASVSVYESPGLRQQRRDETRSKFKGSQGEHLAAMRILNGEGERLKQLIDAGVISKRRARQMVNEIRSDGHEINTSIQAAIGDRVKEATSEVGSIPGDAVATKKVVQSMEDYILKNMDMIDAPDPKHTTWREDPAGLPDQTIDLYFDGHPNEGGKPIDEGRKKLHKAISDKFLKGAKSGKPPVAIMMMGGPASGKSSMVKTLGIDLSNYCVADADAVKDHLPEYRVGVESKYRMSANMAHEESSYLVKEIRKSAINKSLNLVIDGTGSRTESYKESIEMLRKKGYKIKLMMAHCDPKVGLKRATRRAEKSGRYVPEEVLAKAYPGIPAGFKEISALVDESHAFNTGVKFGEKPIPLISNVGGKETVHDPKWKEWLDNQASDKKELQKSKFALELIIRSKAGKEMGRKKELIYIQLPPGSSNRTDDELFQALCRDEWEYTEEEWNRIEKMPNVADPSKGEGVEMVIDEDESFL